MIELGDLTREQKDCREVWTKVKGVKGWEWVKGE